MKCQVDFPAKCAITEITGDDFLLVGVNLDVRLQRITLTKGLPAVAALVGFLPSVNPEVSLEFKGVSKG